MIALPLQTPGIRVRRVRPSDASDLERFYEDLSADSRLMRFHGVVNGLSHRQATNFCTADHDHREGFVAVGPGVAGEATRIVGHLCLEPDGPSTAEVAIAIADSLQHHGLGRRLMLAGLQWARENNVTRFRASMFAANGGIHRLLQGLGLPWTERWLTPGISEITIELGTPAATAA